MGVPPITRRLPYGLAYGVASALELAYKALPLKGEPRLTRLLVDNMAKHHWYDMEPAKRDLGYRIRVNMDTAILETVSWLQKWEAEQAA